MYSSINYINLYINGGLYMKNKFLALLFVLILAIGIYQYIPSHLSTTSNTNMVEIHIPEGSSLNYVTELLAEKAVIKSKMWFKYQAQSMEIDKKIKPGTYNFHPDVDIYDIFELLEKGNPDEPIVLTIPEGFTLYQIAKRVEEVDLGTAEDFIKATDEYFEEKGYDFPTENLYYKMEGYLYPDTYFFNEKQNVKDIVDTLATTMNKVFTNEYIERAKELDLTIHEVLTLASLVEREAAKESEKAAIAGVLFNRLEKNMLLGIDATVIYGIGKGEKHINRVLWSHLEDPSPFNTYKHIGIPPGPIAAPSKTSIHAVLYPEEHDYLYYVLGEDGHVFNRTYEEHKADAEKYYKTLE